MTWGPFASLDPSQRVLAAALGLSILLHAAVLSINFKFPDALKKLTSSQPLEVVLVNSKTRSRPLTPDVLAQSNLDGGGNTDDNRRAKTPLPVLPELDRGADLQRTTQRVQELEAQQRQLMTQLQSNPAPSAAASAQAQPEPQPRLAGPDLVARSLAIARLEAQISRDQDEYSKRPRKQFVGARASEFRFAQYVEDWRQKVERIGNLNYPEAARGKIYGSLQMAVSIKADGSLDSVEIMRSSGHPILDQAAARIVRMGAPYGAFSADLRRDTDILVITRTWRFAAGDRLSGE